MRTLHRHPVGVFGQWLGRATRDFVAAPASARPLAFFRIGLAAVLLFQACSIVDSLMVLYGSRGLIQRPIVDILALEGLPRVTWFVDQAAVCDVNESWCIRGLFSMYLAALIGLLLGWHTRWTAGAALFLHLTFKTSGNAFIYGVDEFATIALYYCLCMPVGNTLSLDRYAGRVTSESSPAARLALRVLQLHLCVIYFSSGIEKAIGEEWQSGEAIWRALMRRDLGQYDFSWLANLPWLATLACWSTLVVEIGYVVFVWPRWTRKAWAWGTIGLHAGIAVCLGLWSFSAVMIVLTGSAFLVSPDPQESVIPESA
jgi:hypothetical protein